ncbi:MFS general substrate transporter [Aspergillus cavernicola]|uniref:MFS general substrate transporter n=1 Tax=Aspergillus cavernicola TaxID=176166 RepID=A0ABR4HU91_9EURO
MVSQQIGISETEISSECVPSVKKAVEFSQLRKNHIVLAGTIFAFNGSLGASLPSGASSSIAQAFQVSENDTRIVLLNSLYLVGFVVGPLFFGPLSECVGRRPVLIGTYLAFAMFTLTCALSPTLESLLVFRFFCGVNGSVPNAVLGGLYSDIYDDPDRRGKAMAIFMFTAIAGPMAGPLVSGFTVLLSWRWVFWVALMTAGAGVPFILLLPETYFPVLLRKEEIKSSPQLGAVQLNRAQAFSARKIFIRPFLMLLKEPIVAFTSLYLSVVYGILFLFFQAYPVVFEGLYGLSISDNGLAFIPMIFGALMGLCLVLVYASFHSKALAAEKSWSSVEEYRRLPLACVGALSIVVALFWFGWTSYKPIHPALPMMAGIFFGFGYLLVFAAMLNYLTDAYKEASACAQAAASATRAMMAVALPFAATPMYTGLGIHWASSLLGFLAFALAWIPFAFIRYGQLIRRKSGISVE